jgi:hypothetical protein
MVLPLETLSATGILVSSRVSLCGRVESVQGGSGWYYHISYLTVRRWSSRAECLSVVEESWMEAEGDGITT